MVSRTTQPYTTTQSIIEETSESMIEITSEPTTPRDSETTEIDPESSSFTTGAVTDETTRECVCPIPTTDEPVIHINAPAAVNTI